MQEVLAQVQDLKKVMGRNLHLMLRRGENLDQLVAKSEQTQQEAQIFRKRANELKVLQQRMMYCGITTGMMVVLVYVLVVGFCGFGLEYCRVRKSSSGSGGSGN